MKEITLTTLLVFYTLFSFAQNTYYSQNASSTFSTNTDWNTAADGSGSNANVGDELLGTHNYFIQNTHTAVVDGNISVNEVTVGEGDLDGVGSGVGSGIMTIGNNTTARTITINGKFTVKAGATLNVGAFDAIHTITITDDITISTGQDNTGAGSFSLFTSATRAANLTFGGAVTTIIAGQDIVLNDLTINGDQNRIINSGLTINGNLQVSGSGTAIITSGTHTFLGNFTIDANNSWTANTGLTNFNGTGHQDITVNGSSGTASFYLVDFEFGGASPNDKRIVGNMLVTNRTRVFNTSVIDDDPGGAHTFQQFQIDGGNLCTFSNTSSVTFTGSEIRNGSGTAIDGDVQFGDAEIIIDGNCSLEEGDNFNINNNFSINTGYLVMKGISDGTDESTITDLGSNSFTVKSGSRLYLRGVDNFPTSFNTYSFESSSNVHFDANFSQSVRGISGAPFDRVILSQSQDQSGNATKTLQTDLDVNENLYLSNGIILDLNAFNLTTAGRISNDDGATITSASGNITLDGEDINQTVSNGGFTVNYSLGTGSFIIDHSAPSTAIRTVNIDVNIQSANFSASNAGGSNANYLIVDVDNFAVLPTTNGAGNFTLGSDVRYYTSGLSGGNDFSSTVSGFLTTSLDASSYVRFDGNGSQLIPPISGGYGFIDLAGNGDKTATGNVTVVSNFSRTANTPQFQDGGFTIRIGGNWNMDDNYVDESNMTGTMRFDGTNQQISESEFNNLVFEGSGIKTIVGALDLSGTMTVDGVTVNASNRNIEIAGAWTESNSGVFTQTTGQTTFNGTGFQAITTLTTSSFGDVILNNSSGVLALSDITVMDDFDFATSSGSILNLFGRTLTIGGDWLLRAGCTFNGGGTSTLIFNGSSVQNLYNYVAGTSYDNVEFNNIGIKYLREQTWDVNDNFTIGSGATLNANAINITVEGDWSNAGNFQQYALVTFDGVAQSISSSSFHEVDIAGSGTKTLTGNITSNGDFTINSTLDVSVSNYTISVEEDWTNNGTFTAQQGAVTINGGYSLINTGGTGTTKSFYDLQINVNTDTRAELTDDVEINGDLTITNGQFRIRDFDMFLAGGLSNSGTLNQNSSTNITLDGSSGTHAIDLGSSDLYHTTINAAGATYQLTNSLTFQQDEPLDIVAGTLDLNGNTLSMGDGSDGSPNAVITLTGGVLIVDEGAVLKIHEGSTFTNSGGTLQLLGVDGNPATMTVNGDGFYDYLQDNAAASFEAQYYVIASTDGKGVELQTGSITNMSNGTFTSGSGTSYLTLTGMSLGAISSSNIIFNSGPTFNVEMLSGSGTISFIIAGGTLAGASFENDNPNGGATTGFIRWAFPAGNTWTAGAATNDWHTAGNWSLGTVPTSSDFVYIDSNTSPALNTVNVTTADAFAERVFLLGTGMTLNLNGGDLTIANADSTDGNFTMQTGNTFSQATLDTLYLAGSWSEDGTYDISNNPTIAFIGTDGSHTISPGGTGSGDRFYNLYFNAGSTTIYSIGSNTRVQNSIELSGGTLDASSGFDIDLYGDWTVNGGFFNAGTARVNLRANSKTQNISGGTFYELYVYGSTTTKEINSNIAVAGTLRILADVNVILDGNENTIFLAGTWDNEQGPSGFTQTGAGSVILNGASQTITADANTTFNNIIFQGTSTKNIYADIIVNGDASIISNCYVDMEIGGSMTGTGSGTLSMTDGFMRVYDVIPDSNFPTGFGTNNFTGGRVDYLGDGNQNIIGGVDYFDLILYSASASTPSTKLATADFNVNDDLTIGTSSDSETTLSVSDGVTITLVDNLYIRPGAPQVAWGTNGPTGGTLHHIDNASGWSLDADITGFNNLILDGTGNKYMTNNLAVTGDLTVKTGNVLNMEAYTLAKGGAATIAFTLEDGTTLDSEVLSGAGTAFPTGFDSYSIHPTSIVRLDGTSSQIVYSTPDYGILYLYSIGNATLDGNLNVEGDFNTIQNTTLVDGGFDMNFAGSSVDIRNYTPSSSARTVNFDGADQIIRNDNSGTPTIQFPIVVFSGSGTKILNETMDIDGNLTIAGGVVVTPIRDIDFSGDTWQNNGTFTHTSTTLPITFSGLVTPQTIDPGSTNSFGSLIFDRQFGTTTIANNGLNIENGSLTVNANAIANFGSLTHTIASNSFIINGTWNVSNANLTFDRAGTQVIPPITAQNIVCATSGSKQLSGDWNINDLTIDPTVTLDVTNSNYTITLTGNWLNNGGTFNDRNGTVEFESNDANPKSITAGGSQFYNVTFNQAQTNSRTYTIPAATTFQEDLTIGSGATLDLNGQVLTLGNNDADDPPGEEHTIQSGGTLLVDANAVLQFDCTDNDNNSSSIGATLNVDGTFTAVGTSGNIATVTRSAGSQRIQIIIDPSSGGSGIIGAQYYHFQYLSANGLVLNSGATLNATNNFSNGTWSNLNTSTSAGAQYYLQINTDNIGGGADINVPNVTFNFSGAPTIGTHYNVGRTGGGLSRTITFQDVSNGLLAGASFEDDSNNQINWPTPVVTTWLGTVDDDWYKASNWTAGVPTALLEAYVPLGQNISRVDPANGIGAICKSLLIQGDGILKLVNDGDLDIEGDVIIGDGTGTAALVVAHTSSELFVQGSWSTVNPAVFDHGSSTVTFDAAAGSVSVSPNSDPFYNITFNGDAIFNLIGTTIDVDGSFTITKGTVTPASSNYTYTVAGDFIRNTINSAVFDNVVAGVIELDGATQTLRDMTFYDLTVNGSMTKTFENTNTVADDLIINSTLAAQSSGNAGTLDLEGDITINTGGVFDDGGQTGHTFAGGNWIAGAGSYSGSGLVSFDAMGAGQDIESVDGTATEFSNVTFIGTGDIDLLADVNVTGNVTITNSINTFDANTFVITNTSGVGIGTFFLDDNELLYIEGANNFPAGFAVYDLQPTSDTRYFGTNDQTIRGAFLDGGSNLIPINYGHLNFDHPNTKTLSGDIGIQSDLIFRESTLDVTLSSFNISIGDDWINNNGGSFIARNGNVTFNGGVDQRINNDLSGTKSFYNIIVDNAASTVDVDANDITILNNLSVLNGLFTASGYTINVAGNLVATNGTFATSGTYNLNTTNPTAFIQTNSSVLFNLTINADLNSRVYNLEDDFTIIGNFTLNKGTFKGEGTSGSGKLISLGNGSDVVSIAGGIFQVGKSGTLALGSATSLTVTNGGTLEVVGSASNIATVTRNSTGTYNLTIENGTIAAQYYLFEYMSTNGIFINTNGLIDATNNFSNGTFTNGPSGGTLLKIENTQAITGLGRMENISFPSNPGGGASNVYKNTASSGDIEIYNSSGDFAGEDFDQDPFDLITWTFPPGLIWSGVVSSDWYNERNWVNLGGVDTEEIPDATKDATIPDPGSSNPVITNLPEITDDDPNNGGQFAQVQNLTIEPGAFITINSIATPADDELTVSGDLTMEASSRLIMNSANDRLVVSGNWGKDNAALFVAGSGTVELSSASGIKTLNNGNDKFYNLEINVNGTVQLSNNTKVLNDFTISSGTFSLNSGDFEVGGDFVNSGTFSPGTMKTLLNPLSAGTILINSGGSSFYDLELDGGGAGVTYQLTSNSLSTNGVFDLTSGTLDPNGQVINFGNNSGVDNTNIYGSLTIGANETMRLGSATEFNIKNGGTFNVVGSSGNLATIAARTSGNYSFTVESGGNFGAQYYQISNVDATGIYFKAGAIIDEATNNLSNGSFSGGQSGGRYILFENDFAGDFTANSVVFNSGPAVNAGRLTGANNITFDDATGVLAGSAFEDDNPANGDADGRIRWIYSNLITWTGATSTDWNTTSNWDIGTVPVVANNILIPTGLVNYPLLNAGADGVGNDITIDTGGSLTIDGSKMLDLEGIFLNSGTVTHTSGTVKVAGNWTNLNTYSAGAGSIVQLDAPSGNISIETGGSSFSSLTLDSDDGGNGNAIFETVDPIQISENFILSDGELQITNPAHTITATNTSGGALSFTLNAGGTLTHGNGTIVLAGTSAYNLSVSGSDLFNLSISNSSGVSLASNITVANDLTVSGIMSLGTFIASLRGNLQNTGTFNSNTGTLLLNGSSLQSITSNSLLSLYNLTVDNNSGIAPQITLNNAIEVTALLTLTDGNISTNSTDILHLNGGTFSGGSSASYIDGPFRRTGNDDFTFHVGQGSIYARIGLEEIPGSDNNQFQAQYFDGSSPSKESISQSGGSLTEVSGIEYWTIDQNSGTSTPKVRLYWEDGARSEITDLSGSDLIVAHFVSTNWISKGQGSTTGNTTAGSVLSNATFTSFSPISFGSAFGNNPLPVGLTSFEAFAENGIVRLAWETANEIDNDYFTLYRSKDGINFIEIANIDGSGTSTLAINYSYEDERPYNGISYYRLKQTDFDGTVADLGVVLVQMPNTDNFLELNVYPNPFRDEPVSILVSGLNAEELVTVMVIDAFGRQHYLGKGFADNAGYLDFTIENSFKWTSGIYVLRIIAEKGNLQKKIIKR